MTLAGVGAVACAAVASVTLAHRHQSLIRINLTPSEPPGVYLRTPDAPIKVGSLVAFLAPPRAFPYADRHAGYLHQTPILKAVAAAGGDKVCTGGGVLIINGVRRAAILARDSRGIALPHWTACRRLAVGELFVFSNRVVNSFDSRYYGPVSMARAQVYRPFATVDGFWP